MRKWRAVSYGDRKRIEELLKKEKCIKEIAIALGRHHSTIGYEVRKGGGRESYNAEEANKKHHRNLRFRTPAKESRWTMYEERLEILEMQLEIITEKLKELSHGRY